MPLSNAMMMGGVAEYEIGHSVRFNSPDSAYMYRTPGAAGNRRTWTFSCWVKRSGLGAFQQLLCARNGGGSDYTLFYFNSDDTLRIIDSANAVGLSPSMLLRDPSAWYHIVLAVDTTQAETSRVKMYVNGVQQALTGTYPAANQDMFFCSTTPHKIGGDNSGDQYLSGYLADVCLIDGQQLTPSSFGETNATTNQWRPKDLSGLSRGTTGFWLKFDDGAAAANLGYDQGAGTNDFGNSATGTGAVVNISVDTTSPGCDWVTDTPTNNHCVLNPLCVLNSGAAWTNGNLQFTAPTTGNGTARSTFAMASGKWYWEVTPTTSSLASCLIGLATLSDVGTNSYCGQEAFSWGYYAGDGRIYNNGGSAIYGSTYAQNDVIGVAFDADNGKLFFSKNGTWQNSGDPAAGTNPAVSSLTSGPYRAVNCDASNGTAYLNFGQRPFASTPPVGFLALCTKNLPTPSIKLPGQYMNVKTYTADGTDNKALTGVGFQPDLVWIKSRSAATDNTLYDSVRGVQKRLESNNTDAEVTSDDGILSFDSDGLTLGQLAQVNTNAATYAAWCFKKGATPGIDIVGYTGNGSARTIAHSLGVAPEMMIVKGRDISDNWYVYHKGVASDAATDYLMLNSTNAAADIDTAWNDAAPTSSVFSIGSANGVNQDTKLFIAYLFASVAGFSRVGSYVGNGSAAGPMVWTGFRPRWIMAKNANAVSDWIIVDTHRDTYNVMGNDLESNLVSAENVYSWVDFLSNGFKIRNTGVGANGSTNTIVYVAFAEAPFRYALAR